MRYVMSLENSFREIQDATGIRDIDEIVTTFVKAEEQKYSLFNYISTLSTEIDQLEESIKHIAEGLNQCLEIE
jgi:hypothetical protein